MSEPLTAEGAEWRFWEAVRVEARSTWWGRWRWLWIALAVLTEAVIVWDFTGAAVQEEVAVANFVCGLLVWLPAWLGADLLSLRGDVNDPMRLPRPAEVFARFVGRVLPCLFVLGLIAATFVWRLSGVPTATARVAWTVVLLSGALTYASVSALTSAVSRRPRRWIITPLVVVYVSGLARLPYWINVLGNKIDMADLWDPVLTEGLVAPQILIAEYWGNALLNRSGLKAYEAYGGRGEIGWVAATLFLLVAGAALSFGWMVVEYRLGKSRPAQSPAE